MAHFDSLDKNKEVLVLIHGLGSRKENWIPQLPLKRYFRLIAVDLRGHGDDLNSDDINMKSFARDIARLLHSKGIEKANFLGHSLGGAVAQQMAIDYPNMVKSLILANTTSYFPDCIVSNTVKELDKALRNSTDEQFIDGICQRGLYNKDLAIRARESFKLRRDTYIQTARATIGLNFLPTILLFRKPLLLISSSHDVVTPSQNAFFTYMFNPFAKVKHISNCGHLANLDKAEEFNQAVIDFLL